MTTQTLQMPEHKAGIPRTRLLHTKKGVEVELEVRHLPLGGMSYEVFLPDYSRPDDYGRVDVASFKVGEYYLSSLSEEREWLAGKGIGGGDTLSIITVFFPLNPPEHLDNSTPYYPKQMGVGGTVMKEVLRDCEMSGFAATCCCTNEPEMLKLLRNPKFGFEEVPEKGSKFFINVLLKDSSRHRT